MTETEILRDACEAASRGHPVGIYQQTTPETLIASITDLVGMNSYLRKCEDAYDEDNQQIGKELGLDDCDGQGYGWIGNDAVKAIQCIKRDHESLWAICKTVLETWQEDGTLDEECVQLLQNATKPL